MNITRSAHQGNEMVALWSLDGHHFVESPVTPDTQTLGSLTDSIARTIFAVFFREIKIEFCAQFFLSYLPSPMVVPWFHLGFVLFRAYLLASLTDTQVR